jgi:serine/threonine-protein kinase
MYMNPSSPMTVPAIELGQILRGRYRLEALIGLGATSAVYRALDLKTGRMWAIKLMRAVNEVDSLAWQRFVNEGAIISQLCHPNIVAVREFDLDSTGRPFLVMEYLLGEDLLSLLERKVRLPVDEALDIAQQIGSALATAHAMEVVHRDIKPSNIFVVRSGRAYGGQSNGVERRLIKVVDFGIAKTTGVASTQQTANGVIVGTPQYMAPECTRGGQQSPDPRADQWSLAVVLYRMLAGCLPFHDSDLATLIQKIRQDDPVRLQLHTPGLPEHVCNALHRALSKNPDERFPSVQDFICSLHGIRKLRPPAPSTVSPTAASGQLVATTSPPASTSPVPVVQSVASTAAEAASKPSHRRRSAPLFASAALSLAVLLLGTNALQLSQPQSTATVGSIAAPLCSPSRNNPGSALADATKAAPSPPPPRATSKVRPPRETPFPPLRLAGPAGRS